MNAVLIVTPFLAATYFLLFLPFWLDTSKGSTMHKIMWKVIPVSLGLVSLFCALKGIGWL